MKNAKKFIFPVLLVITLGVVYFWQHAVASLPYLPYNCIVPLGILTPSLLIAAFITTLALLKQTGTPHPVRRSFLSLGAMFVPVIMTLVFFLSFVSYRFSEAVLPVIVLPNWPTGIMTMIIMALCVAHLTGLLIYALSKGKISPKSKAAAITGWILLNICLFLLTV